MRRRRRDQLTRRYSLGATALLAALMILGGALVGRLRNGAEAEPPTPRRAAVVWALGDGPDGDSDSKEVAEMVAATTFDRLLYLGDVYDNGTREEFRDRYDPLYGKVAAKTAPTPGNHEWPLHAEGYDPYWRRVRGRDQPEYYAFSLGGWRIISLNSQNQLEKDSPQLEWLRAQLRHGRGTCRIAFWHRPRYSAGERHGDEPEVEELWRALRGKVSIVINGHEHDMQRLKPIDGITVFISGAGGKGLYPVDESDPRLAFSNDEDFGALRLELTPGRAKFAFVDEDGRKLDSGNLRCRRR